VGLQQGGRGRITAAHRRRRGGGEERGGWGEFNGPSRREGERAAAASRSRGL